MPIKRARGTIASTTPKGQMAGPATTTGLGGEPHQRAEAPAQVLTTNQGVPIADDQNSLQAVKRGPGPAGGLRPSREDHAFRSRAHSGAHRACAGLGRARVLSGLSVARQADARRRSCRIPRRRRRCSRASRPWRAAPAPATPPRDVRGFAVKFYTEEGNFDLVGNNIPVFFIQDAIKFPDLIHAVKMEPDRGFPQAASAHDTFWDFVSLMPESMHMLHVGHVRPGHPAIAAHDGGLRHPHLPLRGRQAGESTFVKFHWRPKLGAASVVWDEAVKIIRRRSGFSSARPLRGHRQGATFPSGSCRSRRSTRRPPTSFRSTCSIRPSSSPRRSSRSSRSARWCSIGTPTTSSPRPSRSPSTPATSCRASTSRTIRCCRGVCSRISTRSSSGWAARTSTSSRSTGRSARCGTSSATASCRWRSPRGASATSRTASTPERSARDPGRRLHHLRRTPLAGDKLRVRPESFADHYSQARLFFRSMTEPEQRHIVSAFAFELGKVETPAIRRRMLGHLDIVDKALRRRRRRRRWAWRGRPRGLARARPPIDLPPSPALSLIRQGRTDAARAQGGGARDEGSDPALVATLRAAFRRKAPSWPWSPRRSAGAEAKGAS